MLAHGMLGNSEAVRVTTPGGRRVPGHTFADRAHALCVAACGGKACRRVHALARSSADRAPESGASLTGLLRTCGDAACLAPAGRPSAAPRARSGLEGRSFVIDPLCGAPG
jgi:hypothetical protein